MPADFEAIKVLVAESFSLLPSWTIALLLACSFLGSLMTAAVGVGGGAFLLMVMTTLVPPLALIPLHGIVQMGSNVNRAILTRHHIQPCIVGFFAIGAILAALAAVYLLDRVINAQWIPLLVSVFILWLCWGPMPEFRFGRTSPGLVLGGLFTTLITALVGATGPLVSAWLGRSGIDRWTYTANFAACMSLQHGLKILIFGLAGFVYTPWIPLLIAMIAAGFMGTKVGLKLLGRIPEQRFKVLFRWLLTVLALGQLIRWLFF